MPRLLLRPFRPEWALFCLAILLGAALRFYALGEWPRGIYHDEAYYGLDAVSVIDGARPIFFTANNGREPLYIYILSLSVAAFDRTPFGLRLASALIGTLTIPVTYLLGRALFNRRIGLLAMWVCAITFWPVALSRVSFRAGALPLFLGLAIALGWLAWKRQNIWLGLLGGAAYGLAFNTYTAARVTPLALLVWILIGLFVQRKGRKAGKGREEIPSTNNPVVSAQSTKKIAIAFVAAALIVVAPLGLYAIANPAQVFAREGQLSIFETESGDPVLSLLRHIGLGLGMFNFQGDAIARHNLPGRPVFDLLLSVFFLIGLWQLIKSIRLTPPDLRSQQPTAASGGMRAAFVLVWLAVTLLPTILAEDTPHFLRSIGLLPMLWLIPALGLDAIQDLTGLRRPVRIALISGTLVLSTVLTCYDYFIRYVQLPITNYYFEAAATDLAAEINSRPGFSNRIDDRLWDNFASLRFLIENRAGTGAPDKVQLAVWPYETEAVRAAVAALPAGSQISAQVGALARGDLESTPYSLYTLYIAEPAQPEPVTARFGAAIQLRETRIVEEGDQVRVRLGWSVSSPVDVNYIVFVHSLTGGVITAQQDNEPLAQQYHFAWLKPGDILNDEYRLPQGEQIVVGVYAPDGTLLGEPVYLK